ncbi:MAG: helix-turn-helix transcriptional regulator [Deltaproteobacteria bacterium]|nr:helix-turn-helix transcriptional regulator [Deltaproteobacteria bacterium]
MPDFRVTTLQVGSDLRVIRALCDGCDPARPCEEHSERPALWVLTAGAFVLRDRGGKHVVDPTQALLIGHDHAFTISHPAGPDTCIGFRGPLVERLVTSPLSGVARHVPLTPRRLAGLIEAVRRAERERDSFVVGEALAEITGEASPAGAAPARADRALAEALIHLLRVSFATQVSLAELADATGYSLFHACRVFRAVTGTTIHGYRRELRLRHALARILDGDEPLASVAAATGFASQSHLTNLYRARFGITPARTRTREGLRRLAA